MSRAKTTKRAKKYAANNLYRHFDNLSKHIKNIDKEIAQNRKRRSNV